MKKHKSEIRVRYAETDQMGYVYYGKYAEYLEVARVEWIRSLGYSYKELEENFNVMLPVYELNIKYKNPALYDDVLTLETIVAKEPTIRVDFQHEIFNQNNLKILDATVTLVFVNKLTRKPCKAPSFFIDAYKKYFL